MIVQPEISLIVPVFNGEQTIKNTIQYIKAQSFRNFEVLIVDDGSSDNTVKVCQRAINNDKRFILLEKTNGGASSARNTGIVESKGKWIVFMDSDDEIDSHYLTTLYNNRVKAGVCMAGFYEKSRGDISISVDFGNKLFNVIKGNYKDILKESIFFHHPSPIAKIFDGEVIRNFNIRFIESINLCEDLLFWIQYIIHGREVKTLSPVGYIYLKDNSTLTKQKLQFKVGLELAEKAYAFLKEFALRNDVGMSPEANSFCALLFMNAIMAINNATTNREQYNCLAGIRTRYGSLIRKYYIAPTRTMGLYKWLFLHCLKCFNTLKKVMD